MTEEHRVTIREKGEIFALPDMNTLRNELTQVRNFQAAVKELLIEGHDFGVIPGTNKPTLLKPGAEKIDKILKLADSYSEVDKIEDFDKPLFYYKIKCSLTLIGTDILISEGMGSCSSMESKYRYRWVGEKDIPDGIDKDSLPKQKRTARNGGHWYVYRLENDDIYTLANTILKMAKKRAHIDASLSAGRLSDVFTQDIEDISVDYTSEKPEEPEVDKTEHWCSVHNTAFFKKGKMKNYAHPIEGTDEWCNEPQDIEPEPLQDEKKPEKAPASTKTQDMDFDVIKASLKELQWNPLEWIKETFEIDVKTVTDAWLKMNKMQRDRIKREISERLEELHSHQAEMDVPF